MRRKLLVIGGAGLIGHAVVRRALMHGYHITVIDNLSKGLTAIAPYIDNIKVVRKDILDVKTKDIKGFDNVVNLAAMTLAEGKLDPELCTHVNCDAAVQVAELCQHLAVEKYIFSSTCSNYGINKGMADETSELYPTSAYAKAKVGAERGIGDAGIILRFATAFGISPRFREDLILHEFCLDAIHKGLINIFGPDHYRPIAHFDDLARGVLCALEYGQQGEIYNIGSTMQNYTKMQLAAMVISEIPHAKVWINTDESKVDPRNYCVNFTKAVRKLHYDSSKTMMHSPIVTIKEFASMPMLPKKSQRPF